MSSKKNDSDFAALIESVATHLLGAPNKKLSKAHELRFGKKGSFSVNLRKGTWYDWETSEGGGVIDLVARECNLSDRMAAVDWLKDKHYLDEDKPPPRASTPAEDAAQELSDAERAKRKLWVAMKIWRESTPAAGTPVEAYLAGRRIAMKPLPARLRFARLLYYDTNTWHPGMVGLVTSGVDDHPTGIHRTYLAPGGAGKAALDPAKMMLGQAAGGCVKLGPPASHIMVGEGIETCLAVMQATGVGAWAALGTSGMAGLELPPEVTRVTVLADNDLINPKTGKRPGIEAAKKAAARWREEGRDARIAMPPEEDTDFADMLMQQEN